MKRGFESPVSCYLYNNGRKPTALAVGVNPVLRRGIDELVSAGKTNDRVVSGGHA